MKSLVQWRGGRDVLSLFVGVKLGSSFRGKELWREQPSQSKSSILPALPEGEPSVVLFIYVLQQKPLPEGEASVVLFVYA